MDPKKLATYLTSKKHIVIEGVNSLYEQSTSAPKQDSSFSIESLFQSLQQPQPQPKKPTIIDLLHNKKTPKETKGYSFSKTPRNETSQISDIMNTYFSKTDNPIFEHYYAFGTNKQDSFLESILLSLDVEYRTFRFLLNNNNKNIPDRKKRIASEVVLFIDHHDDLKKHYHDMGIKYKRIPKKLFSNDNSDIEGDVRIFLADFFNTKVLLLNMKTKRYRFVNEHNQNTTSAIIMIEHKYNYEPILSETNTIDSLYQFIINHILKTIMTPNSLRAIYTYKLRQLREIAIKLGISIFNGNKKKLKNQLYEDIQHHIKDI
tara:strand:- start:62 stop:1012 length:951 start_codon:yes stop_codon:yes gene_type:complete